MKKYVLSLTLVFFLIFLLSVSAFANSDDWKDMPIITHVYELSRGKITLEWEGNSDIYQIYVDGENADTVNIKTAIIQIKPGLHQITVVPINYESKNVNTNIEINIERIMSGSIDLGSLGIDPKILLQGTPSETFMINYTENPLLSAVPQVVNAFTDFDGRVLLSFTDNYDSDVFRIAIKSGKDVNYVEFDTANEDVESLISKENSTVTITLDADYLREHGCMVPELEQEYSFSVRLQKRPENYVNGVKEATSILESKDSKAYEYTPYAAWKNSPEIQYASQTADGQVTLRWEHEDNGLGCEYQIVSYDEVLFIKRGETEVGKTPEKEYVISDLMNGKHTYAIVPLYSNERGIASEEVTVEVSNRWVAAPALECETGENNQVKLRWTSPEGVESYHIIVSAGSGSLLRYVNLDYQVYKELDVQAVPGDMEYVLTYDQINNSENGVKLKFEIYGIRHTSDGEEQKSATATQTITIK